jgi:zinc protease
MRLAGMVAFWVAWISIGSLGGCTAGPITKVSATPTPQPVATERDLVIDHLPNGAIVLVKPSHVAPVVTVRGYVRTGGLYEGEYLGCGISHLTEHLVAQGAEHLMEGQSPGEGESNVPDRVRQIGGQSNAYTSLDHTCYFISAESSKAMDCIDLVVDWLARPQISQADFDREHGVVQREIEMSQDDPDRQLWYAHAEDLFGAHPAGVPVIGYLEPLRRLGLADLRDYLERTYVPQNMVFVIVGDVDARAVLERVRRAMGDVPRGRSVERNLPQVPPVVAERRRNLEMPTLKETLQSISFQTIPLLHEDLYALDLLSNILSEGETSRLPERILRRRKLVTAISTASWTPPWGRGAFSVDFRCASDKADAAEDAIVEELKALTRTTVSDEELNRAKRQKVTEWALSQQTAESQAATLGSDFLSTGDPAFSADYTRRIQAVTAEQVRDVARRYFAFDRMVVTRLAPPAHPAAATAPAGTQPAEPSAEFFTLPNGLRVILGAFPSGGGRGLVSMALVTEGGGLLEDANTNGLGALMMALSVKGAGDLSADDIAKAFHTIVGVCGNNTFYWQGTVLDDQFPRALEVFAQVVQRPTFRPQELEILRPAQLAAIERVDQEWEGQLQKVFRRRFFAGSPFSMLSVGSRDVVADATRDQIVAHHRRCLKAGGSVLAIYGCFDPAATRTAVEKLFADLPAGRVVLPQPPPRKVAAGGERYVLKTDKQVAAVIVASPGMKFSDLEDRLAIDVLDTIISGYHYPSGWLHNELRGKRLVYMVHAYNWPGLAPGAFVAIAACQPENAGRVVRVIQRDLARAMTYLPSQEELDQAVNTILTAELLESQSAASLALSAALDELYGLGYDWRWRMAACYRTVRPQDVRGVAQKYFSRGLVTVVTSPGGEESLKVSEDQPEPSSARATPPASTQAATGATHDP